MSHSEGEDSDFNCKSFRFDDDEREGSDKESSDSSTDRDESTASALSIEPADTTDRELETAFG